MDRFFTPVAKGDDPEAEQKRYRQLRKHLGFDRTEDTYRYGLYGGVEEALTDYREWKRSGYVVYPFAGGRREQPWWVLKNFETLELLSEFYELDEKHGPKVVKSTGNPAAALTGKLKRPPAK